MQCERDTSDGPIRYASGPLAPSTSLAHRIEITCSLAAILTVRDGTW